MEEKKLPTKPCQQILRIFFDIYPAHTHIHTKMYRLNFHLKYILFLDYFLSFFHHFHNLPETIWIPVRVILNIFKFLRAVTAQKSENSPKNIVLIACDTQM